MTNFMVVRPKDPWRTSVAIGMVSNLDAGALKTACIAPTLLRGSAPGFTVTIQRLIVGATVFGVPALAVADSTLLFHILVGAVILALLLSALVVVVSQDTTVEATGFAGDTDGTQVTA